MKGSANNNKKQIPTLAKFISVAVIHLDCLLVSMSVGKRNTCFYVKMNGLFVRVFPLHGVLYRIVSSYVRRSILHLRQFSVLAVHPGEHQMYESVGTKLYYGHMTDETYASVGDCRSSEHKRTHGKRKPGLKLLYPDIALGYICMDILGPLPMTGQGSKFVSMVVGSLR